MIGLATFGAGCDEKGGSGSSKPPRIALIMKAQTNPFFDLMAEGAEQKAKEMSVVVKPFYTDKETDAEQQAALVENATSQGFDAILIAPADSKAIIAPLLQAQARGIKIINLDNRIDPAYAEQQGLKILAFVGPDNEEGARKSAAAMIQAIGGKGEVAMLEGIRGVDNAEQRKRGFQQAVEAAEGKVTIAVMDTAQWMTEPAQRKMESILVSHADVAGVFCANDMMALGVISAIESAGKTGRIVVAGYDNLQAAQDAIKAGKMLATIDQHPEKMGAMGVQFAVDALRGETIPDDIPVPTDLVTAETLK